MGGSAIGGGEPGRVELAWGGLGDVSLSLSFAVHLFCFVRALLSIVIPSVLWDMAGLPFKSRADGCGTMGEQVLVRTRGMPSSDKIGRRRRSRYCEMMIIYYTSAREEI